MELWNATKLAFTQYATFTGRTNRADYWYFILTVFLASTAMNLISDDLGRLLSFVTFLPTLTAAVRRLRDAGESMHNFWWLLLPIVGWVIWIVKLAKPSKD